MKRPSDLDRLLAHDAWIRRLAGQLARDPSAADDLVQDAWVVALESRHAPRSLSSWLGGVVRNLARQLRRGDARRTRRERRASKDEALPSVDEVVEEVALRKHVAAALLELEEPYRTTLYLRFFRDLSLREIAQRLGEPRSTVHDRVQRGLARLRERLDRDYGGDRGAWALTLLPLAKTGGGIVATTLGGSLAVSTTIKVAVSVAVLGGAVGVWWQQRPDDGERALASAPARVTPAEERGEVSRATLADAPGPPAGRSALGGADAGVSTEAREPAQPEEPAPPATLVVEGRVIDVEGRAMAGLEIRWRPKVRGAAETKAEALAHSDAAGRFRAELAGSVDPYDHLVVHDASFGTLIPALADAGLEAVIVVARRTAVAGHVVDATDAPLAGANVGLGLDQELFRLLGIERPFAFEPPEWNTTSDAEGRFALPAAMAGGSLYLLARKPGYEDERIELAHERMLDALVVVMQHKGEHDVWGTVLDPAGAPLPDAQVSLGGEIARTDPDGAFRLSAEVLDGGPGALVALKSGFLPTRLEFEAGGLVSPVVLQLDEAPVSIHGRVVDDEGAPLAGITVWVRDPTPFGAQRMRQGEQSIRLRLTIEEALRGGFGSRGARTDESGRFELGGLLPREYDVGVFEPATFCEGTGVRATAGAGEPLEIVLEREATSRVAGRVVSLSGEPVEGVAVLPARNFIANLYDSPPISGREMARATTDADGRFEFDVLALEGTALALMDDSAISQLTVRLADYDDLENIEIAFPRRCDLRVELANPDQADRAQVLDAEGAPLRITESFGIFMGRDYDVDLTDGRSSVLQVDERARTLVLWRGEEEVARVPLALVPGVMTVVP